jgi:tRNA pseudouridine13 synthase
MELPYLTIDLPGIGGRIREKPEHFEVEEIPLYEPSGKGTHLYINITKKGINTRDIQLKIAQILDLPLHSVSFAGLKDKNAVTTQTFSIELEKTKLTAD